MSGELKHIAHDSMLQSLEQYEAVGEHVVDGQTTGDLLYFDGSYWVRKARGFLNKTTYVVAADDSNATQKLTADLVCTGTSSNPIDATTINSALSNYSDVLLLAGNYYINAALVPLNRSWLHGQGMYRTVINNKGSTYGIDFEGTSSASANRKENLILENFGITGNSSGPSLAGLYSRFTYGPNICRGVRFFYSEYGVQLGDNGSSWTFEHCRFDSNHIGTELGVSTNPTGFMFCVWSSNGASATWGSVGPAMLINGNTNQITIIGGNMNSSADAAIKITSACHTIKATGVHFEDNAAEMPTAGNDNTSTTIYVNHASASNIEFEHCWFNGEDSGGTATRNYGITVVDGVNVISTKCGFRKLLNACYNIASGKTLYTWLPVIESASVPATADGAGTLLYLQTGASP